MRRVSFLIVLLAAPSLALAADTSVTLAVENMTCATCPITVRMAINAVMGVKEVDVDFAKKAATVVFDDALTNVDALAQASTEAGFPATRKD
jgi:mercuric ion binding protein